jgi:ABC-type uncharacterized transport system permease subunit
MNTKIIGFALLGLGVVLLYLGYNASQSVGAQLSKAFSGSLSEKSMMYYAGGAICTAVGAFLAFWSRK